ncbi:D-alanyl-D-alanine carboxypeptidase [Metallumcola ferriviriculae]|uniref:serine-type D-Ala-D-Ala carboxypeptidase n=1 Tax=Metallumcola ferriviriculae TaxID=3039180 RepID=A0AAU0US31_9FIRM|nr:D-alanyl-D-alanine carboxypeptidase [Desulfitibacteraceae bacterium MK1]
MKRKLAFTLIFTMLFSVMVVSGAYAVDLNLDVESAALMDAATGKLLYDQDAHKKWYPASMTKMMTLIVALEAVEQGKVQLTDKVTASENACSYGGSQVWLEPGETFTLEKLLIAVAVGSANDASVAVAEYIGGTEENFVDMMNKRAKELGAKNTHFVNSHGLHDDDHYTTAYDMAVIGRHATTMSKMMEIVSTEYYEFRAEPELKLWNLNKLLWWYKGADGLKTGTTSIAKRNLTATAQREGLRLVAVVMGVEKRNGHFSNAMNLLNYGFNTFKFHSTYSKGDKVGIVDVSKGLLEQIDAVASDNVGFLSEKGEEVKVETKVNLEQYVEAPIEAGQKLGEVVVYNQGEEVNRVDLVAAQAVERAGFFHILKKTFRNILGK